MKDATSTRRAATRCQAVPQRVATEAIEDYKEVPLTEAD
jgi:hypothetical protein